MLRLDNYLVAHHLIKTRSLAKQLILSGAIKVKAQGQDWRVVTRASLVIKPGDEVQLTDDKLLRYVSRGGIKLEGAIKKVSAVIEGAVCLDIGQSTGGFTDCLLKGGARFVYGVDVGSGQLSEALRADERVCFFENVNAKSLDHFEPLVPQTGQIDLAVMDVSFISMTKILPGLEGYLKPGGHLLSLVKPQFELDKQSLNKKGIVKDPGAYDNVKSKIERAILSLGLEVIDYFESTILGGDGNKEFFVYAKKN